MSSISSWRQVQKENFTRIDPLLDFLALAPSSREQILKAPRFPLNLPRRLAQKIAKNTLDDPIFLQFVPLIQETVRPAGFCQDPVQDLTFRKTKKLLHKYHGRALILCTSACAMHCRFCFRQNFPYETEVSGFEEEIEYLTQEETISEVILSGGDPLSLSDRQLSLLLTSLDKIPHIRRIRFHTRFPIGIPERIDAPFLELLSQSTKQIYFVIHCNHPNELDPEVLSSLQQLKPLGITLLSQSVLLKGVNDNPQVLIALFETLVNSGILPYYLHELDLVNGAAHFLSPQGPKLIHAIQPHLSGYAIPRLVREEAGKPCKTVLHSGDGLQTEQFEPLL